MVDPSQSRKPQFPSDLEARIFQIAGKEAEQGDLAKAIRRIHLDAGSVVGDEFFDAISTQLARAIGADFIFIGRLNDKGDTVHTLVACHKETTIDNIVYDLAGTPCEETVSRACCVFPVDVAAKFPKDEILVEQGAEGYVGVALFDSTGKAIGLIAAVYLQPVRNPEFASTMLMSVASRTAAEVERQTREQEKQLLEAQILSAQKLESLGVLAGGLAHDFNNILATILGSADLAEQDLDESHQAIKRIGVIQTAATSAGELCRQLLAYAGKGRFEVVSADLSELVLSQEEFLRSSVHKNAQLTFSLASDIPTCEADLSQLRQIILNLVINASEALNGKGGAIEISTGAKHLDAAYMDFVGMSARCEPGDYVYLQVADSGYGMDADVRAKLFDPFFSTKAAGRGLGLSAILGIARGHKGWVHVDSKPGCGSRFTVYLPVQQGDAMPMKPIESSAHWRGSGIALLVDDDLSVLEVSSEMLRHIGFEVIAATSGAEALDIFRERNHELSVVLLDLTMPGLSGDETFRRMHEINQQVPVVLSSGYNEQDTVQKFAVSGLAGFLQKPMRLTEMRDKLRLAIDRGV